MKIDVLKNQSRIMISCKDKYYLEDVASAGHKDLGVDFNAYLEKVT